GAGILVCLAGAGVVVAGMLLPAPIERVAEVRSDLHRARPACRFRERHRTHVNAPPESVDRAIRAVSADEIRLFRTLTWIRSGEGRLHLPVPRRFQPSVGGSAEEPVERSTLSSLRSLRST